MDINGVNNKPVNPASKAATLTKLAGAAGRPILSLTGDKTIGDKKKLGILAKEFESIFIGQMLKTMRSTIPKDGLINGGRSEEIFTGLLDDEMAKEMAYQQKDGLASVLTDQLAAIMDKRQGVDTKPANEDKTENGKISVKPHQGETK